MNEKYLDLGIPAPPPPPKLKTLEELTEEEIARFNSFGVDSPLNIEIVGIKESNINNEELKKGPWEDLRS